MGQHSAPRAPRPARSAAEARFRLIRSLQPRASGTQSMITVLFVLLGFATTAAISNHQADTLLTNARQADLVTILDDLSQREARLKSELDSLEQTRKTLLGGDQYQALVEAQKRAAQLAQLAGSEPATGAGIVISVSGAINAITMLDAIQELRDAGASAIQVSDKDINVRVIANSWFADSSDGITVSGNELKVPLTITVLGDASVLAPALEIPGGLEDSIGAGGGTVSVRQSSDLSIKAVIPLPEN